jgi:transcription elongation factor Elf1
MNNKCPKCNSKKVSVAHYPNPANHMATCYACGYAGKLDEFPEIDVFDQITSSYEALADKLVYYHYIDDEEEYASGYTSNLIHKICYDKEEAVDLTVKALKVICSIQN